MKVVVDMKPRVVTANTKDELDIKLRQMFPVTGYRISSYGTGRSMNQFSSKQSFLMVNYEKFRSKRGVRKAHWVAYAYTFSDEFLKATGLTVVQNPRNFDLKKRTRK